MKSVWMMYEEELRTLPVWEDGSKLAGKPVYLSVENWDEVWQLLTADLATKIVNGSTLQTIAGASPMANKDFGDWAVVLVNSTISIDADTEKFFMFHELGHIVREHGTKRVDEAGQIAGILSNLNFEIEADQYAFEHTGYAIDLKKKFSEMIPWSFEKLCGTFKEITASQDELMAIALSNPDIQARQDNIEALVKASVAS